LRIEGAAWRRNGDAAGSRVTAVTLRRSDGSLRGPPLGHR
jgi:hypothetical protein